MFPGESGSISSPHVLLLHVFHVTHSCHNSAIEFVVNQGGHKVGKKFTEFSRLFQSHNYTLPEVITTKISVIWQHLLAILSPHMHTNGYFSWHLLGRVTTPSDHNDPVYPVNSCFTQIFDCTKIILTLIIFPRGCTEFPENSMSFPGTENSGVFQAFSFFQVCGHPVDYWLTDWHLSSACSIATGPPYLSQDDSPPISFTY